MAKTPRVRDVLLKHPLLENSRLRVLAAGCEIAPSWAEDAITFVPLTPDLLSEIKHVGFSLQNHHIVTLKSDMNLIERALKDIPNKGRPRLSTEHPPYQAVSVGGPMMGDELNGNTQYEHDDEQEDLLVVEWGFETDSSVGFP